MILRCPSCGFHAKQDERLCSSCGWDLFAQERIPPSGVFSLPPARNLNEPRPRGKIAQEGQLPALPAQADEADIVPGTTAKPAPVEESGPPSERLAIPALQTPMTPRPQAAPASRHGVPIYIAAAAAAAIGTLSVLAVYLLIRQETAPTQRVSGSSPFAARSIPAETVPPSPTASDLVASPPPPEAAAPRG
ncbi:MAG: hypothetical protein AAB262_02020 [Elusimicrobiota bacterium]